MNVIVQDSEAQLAIMRYLDFIADPTSAVDQNNIDELEKQLANETNSVKKLMLHGQIHKAKNGDTNQLVEGFITHAKAFAKENSLPINAFVAMGVPNSILSRSGLVSVKEAKSRVLSSKSQNGRLRAPKVSQNEIKAWIISQTVPFSVNGVMQGAGGSVGTVSQVVKVLVAENVLVEKGQDPNHSGRGRAPIRYVLK